MALALYRKYRPRTFAEVIGQEHVTEPLSQALRSGRLNHAYLFSGPRGCGKTSSARILARSLNCEQGPTPEPCGQCESCRSLATDGAGSIDVIEIDAASHGGVDDARELREKAFFAPARSRFKIYVIDEAHMVSSAGFNALLKLVEEPPEYVKFIFATTEPEKVLGTIKSRTHHYPFRLIPPKVLRPYLEQLTEAEGVKVEPAVFPLVVRAGGGSARDSLSVLDQLMAGAGPEGVSYARAAALLGVTDSALIDEMCDALAAGDGAAAYATVDRVAEAGHDPRRFASDLLERLRDLIVMQQVPDAAAKGLIDGPDDQIERMAAQAQRLGPATLSRCADIVHNGLVEMRGTTAPRLLLELICARMLLPSVDDSAGGLLQRLERMERRLTLGGAEPPPAAAGPAPVAPAPEVRPATPAPTAAVAAPDQATAGTPAAAGAPTGAAAARAAVAAAASRSSHAGPGTRPADPPSGPAPDSGSAGAPTRRAVRPSAVMPDPATPEPPRPGAAPAGALDAVAVRRMWPEIVGKVGRKSKKVAAWAREATVREVEGQTLLLTFRYPFHAQALSNEPDLVLEALYEELGGRWQIRCEVAGERGAASLDGPARPAAPARPAPVAQPDGLGGTSTHGSPGGSDGAAAGGVPTAGSRSARTGATGDGPARQRDGRAAQSSGGGATASADDEEDWPEPARPGGAEPAAVPVVAEAANDDWPEPARPGAAPVTVTAAAAPAAPVVPKPVGLPTPPAGGTDPTAANRVSGPAPGAPVSSAVAAARAAAAAAAAGGGPGRGQRAGQPAAKTADADWAGEPPYDPDYDGPVGGRSAGAAPAAPAYEGFDPGDEPLDEVIDERTARQSSEEQAVQLLREAFGAEKIDEVDAR
ncbi:DNA polymerase III subunit gamma and tau [Micromonospora chersina]|uniref:DNA polymerase III subunit gamma and tau n=1 Tax=Micromonospora chersina TaxID=47854 RepID=UPI00371626E1